MTDIFERIAASRPVNAAAARQLGAGVSFSPSVKIQDFFADLPPLKPDTYYSIMPRRDEFVDYRNVTIGRLTVIGLILKDSNQKASWVCRCKCGGFCGRKSKSIRQALEGPSTFVSMCGMCSYHASLRDGWTPNLKNKPMIGAGKP